MKNYFIKLFPAEVVREDQVLFFKDPNPNIPGFKDWSGVCTVVNISGDHFGIAVAGTTTACSKEDLFTLKLCNKHFDVGDFIHGEDSVIYNKPKLIVADNCVGPKEGNWANISAVNKGWKITGPVSLEALWLKGNEELEEKEVRAVFSEDYEEDVYVEISNLTEFLEKKNRFRTPGYEYKAQELFYAIKGPCGHFH